MGALSECPAWENVTFADVAFLGSVAVWNYERFPVRSTFHAQQPKRSVICSGTGDVFRAAGGAIHARSISPRRRHRPQVLTKRRIDGQSRLDQES